MAIRTVKVEIPFDKLLSAVAQLTDREKAVLRGKLEKDWRRRFTTALTQLRRKTVKISSEEIERNIKKAVWEVRELSA